MKVLFLPATKLMIVSLSLSTVNFEKKLLSLSQVQNKDSSVARTCSHLVTSAVPAHLYRKESYEFADLISGLNTSKMPPVPL